jgi:hypothetical protein
MELGELLRHVTALSKGEPPSAGIATIEDDLRLWLVRHTSGSVNVSGEIQHQSLPRSSLAFEFTSDLATVDRLVAELGLVVERYPVIGAP